jgi:hypothetical protein
VNGYVFSIIKHHSEKGGIIIMSNTTYLNDLLNLSDDVLKNTKIRFIQSSGDIDMVSEYLSDHNKINEQALFWRTEREFFKVEEIAICLLKLKNDYWLLTTIKEVKEILEKTNGINYKGKEVEQFRKYFGRVIIKYHKKHQTQLVRADNDKGEEAFIKQLEVKEDIGQYFE